MLFPRVLAISLAMPLALAAATPVLAQAYTTRIEPRPFYGAVVTLEEGVRVIRPLPPERQVIINPDHGTALSLGFNETRVYENRTVHNTFSGDGASSDERQVYGSSVSGLPVYGFKRGSVAHHRNGYAGGVMRGHSGHGGGHGGHGGGHGGGGHR